MDVVLDVILVPASLHVTPMKHKKGQEWHPSWSYLKHSHKWIASQQGAKF